MPQQADDIVELMGRVSDRLPDLVLIGGLAVQVYGGERLTEDIDFIPALTDQGWRNIVDGLQELGFEPVSGYGWKQLSDPAFVRDLTDHRAELRFQHSRTGVKLDLLIGYAERHAAYRGRAKQYQVDEHTIAVVSREDLIALKTESAQIADRWKDKIDLEFLTSKSPPGAGHA